MNVNIDQVRDDLKKLDTEIALLEDRLTKKHAERSGLLVFLRVAEVYQTDNPAKPNGKDSVVERVRREKARPVKVVPAMTLHRDSARRQTIVATRLIEKYSPGEIFTISDAVERLGFLPLNRPKDVSEKHHLSSFLSREADASNGVLERINKGKYRLRDNAEVAIFPIMNAPSEYPVKTTI